MLWYGETQQGCGIRAATSKTEARRIFQREAGDVACVREATKEDVCHVRAMGGYIPERPDLARRGEQ